MDPLACLQAQHVFKHGPCMAPVDEQKPTSGYLVLAHRYLLPSPPCLLCRSALLRSSDLHLHQGAKPFLQATEGTHLVILLRAFCAQSSSIFPAYEPCCPVVCFFGNGFPLNSAKQKRTPFLPMATLRYWQSIGFWRSLLSTVALKHILMETPKANRCEPEVFRNKRSKINWYFYSILAGRLSRHGWFVQRADESGEARVLLGAAEKPMPCFRGFSRHWC